MSTGNPRLTMRVPEPELALWDSAASKAGLSTQDWLRGVASNACGPAPKKKSSPKPAASKKENQLARATRIRKEWEELLREHHSVAMSEFGSLEEYERRQK